MDLHTLEQKIKAHIRHDGRSQAAVARKLDVAPDTFNKWVRGVNRMPDDVIGRLCILLSLPSEQHIELLKLAGYTLPENLQLKTNGTAPILFASKIMPDGRAIDPGVAFTADITDLYAVFSPSNPLTGTIINAEDPDPAAYYAFFKIKEASPLSRVGWFWFYEGERINQFDMNVKPGMIVWLQRFNYEQNGIFNTPPYGRGEYRIVVLLGGNPAVNSIVTIH